MKIKTYLLNILFWACIVLCSTTQLSAATVADNLFVVSTNYLHADADATVSPNPANTETIVSFPNPNKTEMRLQLFNVLGKEIGIFRNHQNLTHIVVNVTNLPDGMYFYYIKEAHLPLYTGRIIVKH